MEREFVHSSNLRSVGYDQETNVLEIEFKGGEIYQYYNVPFEIYQGLMAAPSKGQFHAYRIKNFYRYVRIR